MVMLNGQKVVDIEVDGVDPNDYPDFCDAHFSYAVYEGTVTPLDECELEELADQNPELLHEMAYEYYI